ncbi:MAG TPA: ABC transporter permease subunit [Pirellulaceae bacterium]|nr:ABC transporter permease subunit [Pirellulaceae bacterium]
MNRALVGKAFYEGLVLFIPCAVGLLAFAWLRVWVVSLIDSLRFKQIIDLLPKEFERFSPIEFEWLTSFTGRTALTYEEPMLILVFSTWAIVRGSDVVSGELNRGTMEMVLAQPVSRQQVYWTPIVATLLGMVVLSALVWVGMYVAVATSVVTESRYPEIRVPFWGYTIPLTFMEPIKEKIAMRELIDPLVYVPGSVNLLALGIFLLGLSACISAMDRYRWRTLGIVFGVYFVCAMFKVGAMSTPLLSWLNYFSFFSLYESQVHIKLAEESAASYWSLWMPAVEGSMAGLGPLGHNALLAGGGIAMLIIGSVAFERRDLPAPM